MATIELVNGRGTVLVDDEDLPLVAGHRWYLKTDWRRQHLGATGYAVTFIRDAEGRRRNVAMHRLLTGAPAHLEVDHGNGNGLDNRRSNLEVVTRTVNVGRQRPRQTRSGFRGVTCLGGGRRKPWQARVMVEGKARHIGVFETAEQAADAYDIEARKHGLPPARVTMNTR